jgi:hypothetical protein
MAGFTAATFLPMSAMANSNAPRHWSYTTADAKATVVGSGYFDDAVIRGLKAQDIIWSVDANGGTETFTTVFVDAISAAGVVTTLSTVQILA